MITDVQRRFDEDRAQQVRRSLDAMRHPRPVSDADMALLREAAAPVLRDLMAFGGSVPEFVPEAHEDLGQGFIYAWIWQPAAPQGQGVRLFLDSSPAYQTVQLAEQLQSWKLDELDPTGECRIPWPDCPLHPGEHRLDPVDEPGVAVWCCPDTAAVIAVIGSLGRPLPDDIPRFVQAE